MIKLGSRVRDNITGFSGIATGRVEYLHGEPRILIDAIDSTESKWIDEARLVEEADQYRKPLTEEK